MRLYSHTVFDVDVNVYLMQDVTHVWRTLIGEHDELYRCEGLIVVQLVLPGSERYEALSLLAVCIYPPAIALIPVVVSSKLPHHVAQREYSSEHQLRIILCTQSSWTSACWPDI